jgi:hypothetical protein
VSPRLRIYAPGCRLFRITGLRSLILLVIGGLNRNCDAMSRYFMFPLRRRMPHSGMIQVKKDATEELLAVIVLSLCIGTLGLTGLLIIVCYCTKEKVRNIRSWGNNLSILISTVLFVILLFSILLVNWSANLYNTVLTNLRIICANCCYLKLCWAANTTTDV